VTNFCLHRFSCLVDNNEQNFDIMYFFVLAAYGLADIWLFNTMSLKKNTSSLSVCDLLKTEFT